MVFSLYVVVVCLVYPPGTSGFLLVSYLIEALLIDQANDYLGHTLTEASAVDEPSPDFVEAVAEA
jgi:hypothetical protein